MQKLDFPISLGSLIKFTLPSMVMMSVMSLYLLVDGAFVSRFIGTDALSAVNIVYPMISLIIALGTMFGTGLTAIVSVKLGRRQEREARENVSFVLGIACITGVIATVLSFVFLEPLLYFLGSDESLYAYCRAYAWPLIWFFLPTLSQFVFMTLYVADGKPHIGLILTLVGGLTHIAFDYVFIGLMGMGIAGAAWATGIGTCIPMVFGIVYFSLNRRGNVYFVRPKSDLRVLVHAMTNGSSEMVGNLSTCVTTLLFNLIMMRYAGADGVAAITILLYLNSILIAVTMGYSIGVAPLISYNYGAEEYGRLRQVYVKSLGLMTGIGAAMFALSFFGAHWFTAVLAPKGSAVYEMAIVGLRIFAVGYFFKGISIFASALFTAFGNGKISALLACARTLFFLTICLVVLSTLFGITGVWVSTPIAEALSLALSLFFLIREQRHYHYGKTPAPMPFPAAVRVSGRGEEAEEASR